MSTNLVYVCEGPYYVLFLQFGSVASRAAARELRGGRVPQRGGVPDLRRRQVLSCGRLGVQQLCSGHGRGVVGECELHCLHPGQLPVPCRTTDVQQMRRGERLGRHWRNQLVRLPKLPRGAELGRGERLLHALFRGLLQRRFAQKPVHLVRRGPVLNGDGRGGGINLPYLRRYHIFHWGRSELHYVRHRNLFHFDGRVEFGSLHAVPRRGLFRQRRHDLLHLRQRHLLVEQWCG